MSRKYYLAYGSNLNLGQMQERCPNARIIGTTTITGYRLLFKGSKTGAYLTIEKMDGREVPVAVWAVNEADERSLDRYEGYPTFYYKQKFRVAAKLKDGTVAELGAFAYIMHEERKLGVPSSWYVRGCLEGYEKFGFDPEYIWKAYEESGGERTRVCPKCGKRFWGYPAISREDNETEICSECGTLEALESFVRWSKEVE